MATILPMLPFQKHYVQCKVQQGTGNLLQIANQMNQQGFLKLSAQELAVPIAAMQGPTSALEPRKMVGTLPCSYDKPHNVCPQKESLLWVATEQKRGSLAALPRGHARCGRTLGSSCNGSCLLACDQKSRSKQPSLSND